MKRLAMSTNQKGSENPPPLNKLPGVRFPNAAYPRHPHNKFKPVAVSVAIAFAFFIVLFSGGDDFRVSCINIYIHIITSSKRYPGIT